MVAAAVAAGGCGGKRASPAPASSVEDAALAVAKALAKGDAQAAAECLDLDAIARSENPDWDSFPSGQRGQIRTKMRDEKRAELEGLKGMFAGAGGELKARAQGNAVTVLGASGPVAVVTVSQSGSGYRVLSISASGASR
jgi:hypothetical protein